MPLPLYIFEERYLTMIKRCIDTRAPFGVVLIKKGAEALGPLAQTFSVGTTARVLKVDRIDNDRLSIVAVGEDRFVLHSQYEQDGYWVGEIEIKKLNRDTTENMNRVGELLHRWMKEYLDMLVQAQAIQVKNYTLPDDLLKLSLMGAFLLQISSQQKQTLLEIDSESEFIEQVYSHYRREVPLMKTLIKNAPDVGDGIESRLN